MADHMGDTHGACSAHRKARNAATYDNGVSKTGSDAELNVA